MSVYYNLYAEAQIDGKWYNLSPYYKLPDGTMKTKSFFFAQSVFREVDWDLEQYILSRGIPDDMSADLREKFQPDLDAEMANWGGRITWGEYYRQSLYCVNFAQAFVSKYNPERPYKYMGYILKEAYASFECNEIEEIGDWLTEDEYQALSDKEKRKYIYYRWNEPYGTYQIYSSIVQRVRVLCALFEDALWNEIGGSLMNGITDSQVRVYVYRE